MAAKPSARRKAPPAVKPALVPRETAPSKQIDTFENPSPGRDFVIEFDCPEFTCLCPLTGQPDFAHFTIRYVPEKRCVESKSLKLYLWSFRNEGAFHEKVTNTILDDLVGATAPRFMEVVGRFNVRGGIGMVVTATHGQRAAGAR